MVILFLDFPNQILYPQDTKPIVMIVAQNFFLSSQFHIFLKETIEEIILYVQLLVEFLK